ncbi:p53-induced death domain-containing protein 1-like isoform X2 [Ptychodera flava]|uniref:p53-induced death domain-containing protein 1-like isoform X2 n=1 Tax=Ptychodera flava TaxID=63121 RepID=UPI00396A9F79
MTGVAINPNQGYLFEQNSCFTSTTIHRTNQAMGTGQREREGYVTDDENSHTTVIYPVLSSEEETGYSSSSPQVEESEWATEERVSEHHEEKNVIDAKGKEQLGMSFEPHFEDKIIFCIKPQKSDTELKLSPSMYLEIPAGAIDRAVTIWAKSVQSPPPLILGDHEFLLGDILEFGVDPDDGKEFQFKIPIVFHMEIHDSQALHKTREIVVRTDDEHGQWTDLDTEMHSCSGSEKKEVKATMHHFCHIIVVSKVKQHSFVVNGNNKVTFTLEQDGEVKLDLAPNQHEQTYQINIEVEKIQNDRLERACKKAGTVTEYVVFDTVLKIKKSETAIPALLEISMPVPGEGCPSSLKNDGKLKILRDNNNDRWSDVSMDIIKTDDDKRLITFKAKPLTSSDIRYAVVVSDPCVNIEEVAGIATKMTRKSMKVARFVLLQHKHNKCSLFVECVLTNKVNERIEDAGKFKYQAPAGEFPFSREIDVAEGEKVKLKVGGEGIHQVDAGDLNLIFYSWRQYNHTTVEVGLSADAKKDSRRDYKGYVDFLQHEEMADGEEDITKLRFIISANNEVFPEGDQDVASSTNLTKHETDKINCAITLLEKKLSGTQWKQVGRELGLSDADLDAIECDSMKDYREMKHHMFKNWREKMGRNATLKVLIETLEKLELRQLAEDVKEIGNAKDPRSAREARRNDPEIKYERNKRKKTNKTNNGDPSFTRKRRRRDASPD